MVRMEFVAGNVAMPPAAQHSLLGSAMFSIPTAVNESVAITSAISVHGQPLYSRGEDESNTIPGFHSFKELSTCANVEKIMTYITVTFHTYIRQTITPLTEHWQRVAGEYGQSYPELQTITSIILQARSEILSYLYFKERVLYPLIKELFDREGIRHTSSKELHWRIDRGLSHGETMDLSIGTDLQTIQSLSDNFSAPCESARFCEISHEEMRIFAEQWKHHSYSEIHVLHPKVRTLMRRIA